MFRPGGAGHTRCRAVIGAASGDDRTAWPCQGRMCNSGWYMLYAAFAALQILQAEAEARRALIDQLQKTLNSRTLDDWGHLRREAHETIAATREATSNPRR